MIKTEYFGNIPEKKEDKKPEKIVERIHVAFNEKPVVNIIQQSLFVLRNQGLLNQKDVKEINDFISKKLEDKNE